MAQREEARGAARESEEELMQVALHASIGGEAGASHARLLAWARSSFVSIGAAAERGANSRRARREQPHATLTKWRCCAGERKTDEELLLWHSLSCDELLKDMTTPDSDDGIRTAP